MALENTSPEQFVVQLGDKITSISYWLVRGLGIALIIWIFFHLISTLQEHKKLKLLKEINTKLDSIENKLAKKK